jgi:hypothetical protein
MRPGDIVFVKGKGLVSRIIRFFDKGKYTHVAIAVSSNKVIESQRFVKTRIVEMEYEDYDIVQLDLTPSERTAIVVASHRLLGTRYDYLQIGWHLLKKLFGLKDNYEGNNPNTLICSELVSRSLYMAGIIEEFDMLYELTPNQLYDFLQYIEKTRRPN